MALKTFNIDAHAYKKFSEHCKKEGISMSKKIENFIKDELDRVRAVIPDKFMGLMKMTPSVNSDSNAGAKAPEKEHSFKKYC
jgi:hypothetical protein